METGSKKRIVEPPIIGRMEESGELTYMIRAYDAFITVGENLTIALEIFINFNYILRIKGGKNIIFFPMMALMAKRIRFWHLSNNLMRLLATSTLLSILSFVTLLCTSRRVLGNGGKA